MRIRSTLLGITAVALVASACSVDPSVEVISARPAEPATPTPDAAPPADDTVPPGDTVPADGTIPADDTSPSSDAAEPTTTPAPTTTTTTLPPATTLPPVVGEIRSDVALDVVADLGGDKPPQAHDDFAAAALGDLDRWWSEVYPTVYGEPFEPLQGAVYVGYPERVDDIPGCGEPRTAYEDLQLFVAFYCQFGDFMAYDDGSASPSILTALADTFGPAVLGVVLAHEYGHAVQERAGTLDRGLPTIVTEQQADCFAGAWTGQAYRDESPFLRMGDADVRAGLLAMIEVRDPVGTNQFVAGGHGSAFDRVGAFQVGFLDGPARCAELIDDPLPLMPNEFQTFADQARGGDAPYTCDAGDTECTPAPVFLSEDLDHFWNTSLETGFDPVTVRAVDDLDGVCSDPRRLALHVAVCDDERIVAYEEPALLALYDQIGDFSLGYLYGIGWAEFAMAESGVDLVGERRALLADCYTGAWVRDITPDSAGRTPRGQLDTDGDGEIDRFGVTSSPGDLDEAIQMAIVVGDEGANTNRIGSPFEKIDAFRTGVLGGLPACQALAAS